MNIKVRSHQYQIYPNMQTRPIRTFLLLFSSPSKEYQAGHFFEFHTLTIFLITSLFLLSVMKVSAQPTIGVWSQPITLSGVGGGGGCAGIWASRFVNTLYISSYYGNGANRYDICRYLFNPQTGTLSNQYHLPSPINSASDERGIAVDQVHHTIYFCSDHNTTIGNFRLYRSSIINDTTFSVPQLALPASVGFLVYNVSITPNCDYLLWTCYPPTSDTLGRSVNVTYIAPIDSNNVIGTPRNIGINVNWAGGGEGLSIARTGYIVGWAGDELHAGYIVDGVYRLTGRIGYPISTFSLLPEYDGRERYPFISSNGMYLFYAGNTREFNGIMPFFSKRLD